MNSQLDLRSKTPQIRLEVNFAGGYYSSSLGEYIRFCVIPAALVRNCKKGCVVFFEKVLLTKYYLTNLTIPVLKTGYLFDKLIHSLVNKKKRGTEEEFAGLIKLGEIEKVARFVPLFTFYPSIALLSPLTPLAAL